jgi:hypothetical protein
MGKFWPQEAGQVQSSYGMSQPVRPFVIFEVILIIYLRRGYLSYHVLRT